MLKKCVFRADLKVAIAAAFLMCGSSKFQTEGLRHFSAFVTSVICSPHGQSLWKVGMTHAGFGETLHWLLIWMAGFVLARTFQVCQQSRPGTKSHQNVVSGLV